MAERLWRDRPPEFRLTHAQWLRLMFGEEKGQPRGILAGQESWIARESRLALEALDEKEKVLFDVTWENGQPVFSRRER